MKRITIVPRNKADSVLAKVINTEPLCFYLCEDYSGLVDLQSHFADKLTVRTLSGIFDSTFMDIKESLLQLLATLNKRYDSHQWWSTPIASRAAYATPLLFNVTCLFCVRRILKETDCDVIFIVDSPALSRCMSNIARDAGYQVVCSKSRVRVCVGTIRLWLYHVAMGAYHVVEMFRHRLASFRILKPLKAQDFKGEKIVLLRSWVTEGNFDKHGRFEDRNFGSLPAWLRSQDYEVWILPMFFNVSMKKRRLYTLLNDQRQRFLIPHHYFTLSDYLIALYERYKMLFWRVEDAEIDEISVAPLLNEVIGQHLHQPELSFSLLERVRDAGLQIDAFYYSFEGNHPEKPFILACREHFPSSRLIAFQHTIFSHNVLSVHLAPGESKFHPLPDKIVCSGPIYVELLESAGFPSEILMAGPNLRHGSVHIASKMERLKTSKDKQKVILLPLSFSYPIAFDTLLKVKGALEDVMDYKVYIRNHPLLSKKIVVGFLNKIGLVDYAFADDGVIQDWFTGLNGVISGGGASVTTLEAVVAGVPVIRVIPDNAFFLDPLHLPEYPLHPIHTSGEIQEQLVIISDILRKDGDLFPQFGREVMQACFATPTEENMEVFATI